MTTHRTAEVIYEVECLLDPTVVEAFDAWLPDHVREVIACGGFIGAEIQSPTETTEGVVLRRTQYRLASMAALERYLEQDAPRLRAAGATRFGDKASFSRRVFAPSGVPLRLPETPVTCRNCGAEVPGKFCEECGQSRDIHVLSMHEVVGDVTHSLLHLDSRVWRTLRTLVLRPGQLTNEFIAGKHQLYLPPFRLYLVISVAFFALSALLPDGKVDVLHTDENGNTVVAVGPSEVSDEATRERDAAELREVIGTLTGNPDAIRDEDTNTEGADRPGPDAQGLASCNINVDVPRLKRFQPLLRDTCRKIAADGGKRLGEVFLNNVPKLMFVFLPLMAAIAMLFYWRPRRLYAEHLVTFLHTHALVFTWLALAAILEALTTLELPLVGWLGAIIAPMMLYLPYYVFRAMRVVYGDGRALTAVKFVSIATIYFVLLGVTFAVGLVYTALSL